ncbi:MAG: glycogen synthase GlgA [Spirochaetia bacterium]|nr:glycogen synthase GlgA [Spirochaetia bacterium]NCC89304.1 glycogen synthase GlgA [Spirochaetia bacterium]
MNICMVSSESVPFSKSGGLADVVGALSTALASLGEDVRVLLPLYGSGESSSFTELTVTLELPLLGGEELVTFSETTLNKVTYYFLRHPYFTARKGIYGDTSFTPYCDNLRRFALLNKAVLALCKALDWKPDVIHCHDWTTGFVPYLLKTEQDPFFGKTRSMMTIHNLAYQGEFSRLELLGTDIMPEERMFSGERANKRTNMLKTGLEFADLLTTVSPTYAKEIQTQELGCHLEGLLSERKNQLNGIINGIDYEEWNPETDPFLTHHFSAENLAGKELTKAEIQAEFSLEVDASIPLFAMISRLAEQKGFVELLEGSPCALERMLTEQRMQMIIVGTGDHTLEKKLVEIGKNHPNLSVNILFSNRAAHLLEAGADFFLMPSRYEPCGLNQLYSLRYGTLPVARRTGGLADSIIDLDENPEEGTGILFEQMSGHGILEAVERSLAWYRKGQKSMNEIRTRCMQWDSTWQRSAHSYLALYESSIRGNYVCI